MIHATYHKPNRIGRAWYVYVVSDTPVTDGQVVTVTKRDGRTDEVTLIQPQTYRDGWLCRFKRVTGFEGGAEFLEKDSGEGEGQHEAVAVETVTRVSTDSEVSRDLSSAIDGALQMIHTAREQASIALGDQGKAIRVRLEKDVEQTIRKTMNRVVGRVEYVNAQGQVKDCGQQHKTFPQLLALVQLGLNVWLPGPAGSGKTTAARKVADALGLPFYHSGKVLMEHQLVGYMDAHGRYVSTVFYKAYTEGGVFLQDEADGSEAKALLALNMAIENGEMAFPCGIAKRHADFRLIAAANTFGHGADSDYVGRNQQDKAFLDRFVTLRWDYDDAFEVMLSGNPIWTARVQTLRQAAKARGIKVLITPRASIIGATLLRAGWSVGDVEAITIRKSMTDEQWTAISRGM